MSKISWYYHRLQAMPLAEVVHRLGERLTLVQEQYAGAQLYRPLPPALLKKMYESFRAGQNGRFFFTPQQKVSYQSLWRTEFAAERAATLQVADLLCEGNITLFGYHLTLEQPIDWWLDPKTKRRWPDGFHGNIDTRDGRSIGGVKWVWELNRHHHLVTLAKAYFLSDDPKYANVAIKQLLGWIEQNRPLYGVNWTSGLELSLRLINWMWVLAFVRNADALTEAAFAQIMNAIQQQGTYVARRLSQHSSANNHLIGEVAGLAVVGYCLPQLPAAAQWRRIGTATLTRELPLQIYEDGVPAEQAISYLAFVVDFNLLVWRLAVLNGGAPPTIWPERLAAAATFLEHLMDSDGNVPSIGDSDDAWVVRLDDRAEVNNYESLLTIAAAWLHKETWKSQRWDEKSHWLLGNEGREWFAGRKTAVSPPTSKAFPTGGYCIMRDTNHTITFDCGPLGYLGTAAHGHADALNVLISVQGTPLLVDAGTFAYQEGGEDRDYFRHTAAHNCVVVDGQDQSEIRGTFLWGERAQVTLHRWQTTSEWDIAVAEHDGYGHLGITHKRTLLWQKANVLMIMDEITGNGTAKIQQFWHLHPDWHPSIDGEHVWARCHEKQVCFAMDGTVTMAEGWYSPAYGQREAAPVLCVIPTSSTLPIKMVTFLMIESESLVDIAQLKTNMLNLLQQTI